MRSSLSRTFTAVSAAEFDRAVGHGLLQLVETVGGGCASLIEISPDGQPGHRWMTGDDGTFPQDLPWTMAVVRRGEVAVFTRMEELPDEAAVDRRECLARDITSLLALPLVVGGRLVGALILAAVRGELRLEVEGLIPAVALVGEVFGNALSRQQKEHEIQRLRQDLAHVGRVSAMGELTASLAHELNQPLTAILNNAQVAQRLLDAAVVDVAEIREILSDIVADDKRAAEVIRRLRVLLKKGDLEYVSLDINDVVTEIARLLAGDAAVRRVSLRLDLGTDLPRVRGDRGQLQQVVLNLVLNGLDAMRQSPTEEGLLISTFRHGAAAVAVAVRDAGTGIAEHDAAHIFDALYTTKSDGIGMGLAIARTIVNAHGGRLTAANNADRGATFQFTLPTESAGA